MNRLIIENRSDLDDFDMLGLVKRIVGEGRISNDGKQYCYATKMAFNKKQYMIYTDLNKRSDRFVVVNDV